MTSSIIDALVSLRGIESDYLDAWGEPVAVSASSKANLLRTLGYTVEQPRVLEQQLASDMHKPWLQPLAPVMVKRRDTGELLLTIRLPSSSVNHSFSLEIAFENGDTQKQAWEPSKQEYTDTIHIAAREYREYAVAIPGELPLGYHWVRLSCKAGEISAKMRLIVAPATCYKPPSIAQGKKVWGLSVQLYCLRSEHNWGVGDFTDLAYLLRQAGRQGAQFVGLNPIHALYPANPDSCSPYSPSSRRWINFIYLDVTQIEGYQTPAVQALVAQPAFKQALDQVRAAEYVDYAAVTALKLPILNAIFDYQITEYLPKNSQSAAAFEAFIAAGGESLDMLATYDAIQEALAKSGEASWGWPVFPNDLNEYRKPQVAQFQTEQRQRIRFYMFLQWQAALQLELANQVAHAAGMEIGIYRDLAVGVSEGSAEIWGNRELYVTDANVGAPPDVLGPLGQDWGLPPMDPQILFEQAYQPLIDLFSANMQSSGALRIDHVMALLRLWWVPKGAEPKQGGYVHYPVDDLLGILALESQRHQSMVIGEDLGTVPEAIRAKLAGNGVHSYRVFFFEQAEDGGFFSPSHYPQQSMSALTTHDMPTLTGYWHCHDLELGKQLGLYPSESVLAELYASRHNNKQRILDSLHGHASIPAHTATDVTHMGMHRELNHGMQYHMAKGASALLCLQLEDWLEMEKPVNIPGTSSEYPNWQRKLSRTLQDIFADPLLNSLAAGLTAARDKASEKS